MPQERHNIDVQTLTLVELFDLQHKYIERFVWKSH